jgi:hypothetical protein
MKTVVAVIPVGPPADRDHEQQAHDHVEADDVEERLVGQIEAAFDLRRQRREGGRVEFVRKVEEEQDGQRERRQRIGRPDELEVWPPDRVP